MHRIPLGTPRSSVLLLSAKNVKRIFVIFCFEYAPFVSAKHRNRLSHHKQDFERHRIDRSDIHPSFPSSRCTIWCGLPKKLVEWFRSDDWVLGTESCTVSQGTRYRLSGFERTCLHGSGLMDSILGTRFNSSKSILVPFSRFMVYI